MPVVMKLIRRPRTRKTPPIIRDELRTAYGPLANNIVKDLNNEIADWAAKPKFKTEIHVTGRQYYVQVKIDLRTKMGKIFQWADQGTGIEGPKGQPYEIVPVEADMLVFDVPYQPKTIPQGGLRYGPAAEPKLIKADYILHPGIQPRHITNRVLAKYKDRKNRKGFYRITENAYRRGFRRAARG